MIAATIGRTFLKAYNEKYKNEMTAKQFFEEVFWPLFYNSEKYMQWINNSPFDQISKRKLHGSIEERKKALSDFVEKIEVKKVKDMSTLIGAPASDQKEFATSSGLVSDIEIKIDDDDAYSSWIASGLCLGVGMYSILYNDKDILLDTFEGWKVYRSLLDDNGFEKLKGNQINSWNGLWLNFRYSKSYVDDFDYSRFQSEGFFTEKQNFIELSKIKWSELMFNISRHTKEESIIGYVHKVGDVNKTIGFYQFFFSSARTLVSYYSKLFGGHPKLLGAKKYETIFGDTITKACQKGIVGLQALEPKDLRKYFNNDKNLKLIKPKVNPKKGETEEAFEERKNKAYQKDYESIIYYQTYKTWLLAMITKNKEENLKYSEEVAKVLLAHKQEARVEKKFIEEKLFKAKGRKQFLNELGELIKVVSNDGVSALKDLRDRVYTLSDEDYQYLFTLIKFDYAYQERLENK
jgi:hypothetical protein